MRLLVLGLTVAALSACPGAAKEQDGSLGLAGSYSKAAREKVADERARADQAPGANAAAHDASVRSDGDDESPSPHSDQKPSIAKPKASAKQADDTDAGAQDTAVQADARASVRASGQNPNELSDQQGLQRITDVRSLPVLADDPDVYVQQSSYERQAIASAFPLSGNGNRDYNNFLCASEDAQLPPQLEALAFEVPRCPEPYVHGLMMARFEGSGRLVRMWLSALSFVDTPADDELLRIYVDEEPTPRVELPLRTIMDGSAGEMFAAPFGAASTRRLAWYYPVAFEHKLVALIDKLGAVDEYFYHCDAVMSRPDKQRKLELDPSTRLSARDDAKSFLASTEHAGPQTALHDPQRLTIPPAEKSTFDVEGPATVYHLQLRYPDADAAALASLSLRLTWDDADQPAIDLPLLELFAAVPTPPQLSSMWLSSKQDGSDRVLGLGLPAPFSKRAHFELENTGEKPVTLELVARGERGSIADHAGLLHVARRQTKGPTQASTHVALEQSGRGRLVGLCGYFQGHGDPNGGLQRSPLNLLEADVTAMLDGMPALRGTGTEEYADDVFYFRDAPHSRPFEQAWGISQARDPGAASLCRWHVLGTELDYTESIKLAFELGGSGNPGVVEEVKTVAYYYQAP